MHGQWTSARGSPSKGAPVNGSPDKDFWILPLSLVNSQRQYWLKAAQAQLYSTLALDIVDLYFRDESHSKLIREISSKQKKLFFRMFFLVKPN